MSASAPDIPADEGSHQKKLSWKATAAFGIIVFWGSLGLGFLVREIVRGNGESRPAIVKTSEPDYRIQLFERSFGVFSG
jgi:hypothetical protein